MVLSHAECFILPSKTKEDSCSKYSKYIKPRGKQKAREKDKNIQHSIACAPVQAYQCIPTTLKITASPDLTSPLQIQPSLLGQS